MTLVTLQRRLKALESRVAQLQDELRSVRSTKDKDWRRTIGAFTDDEGLKEILQEALRTREADRNKSRSKASAKRGPKR
jgi:predicted  nucleic acid-binding Zn-ribbon protein